MRPEAVFFDFGNTLVHAPDSFAFVKQLGVQKVLKILPQNEHQIDEARLAQALSFHRDLASKKAKETSIEMRSFDWFSAALAELGLTNLPATLIRQSIQCYYDPIIRYRKTLDYAPELLENLFNRGYRLGIISNATEGLAIRRILATFGFLPWFQSVIISADVGFRKPRQEIFDLALNALQVQDPSRAVIIGDRKSTDILGAHRAGLRSIHLTVVKNTDEGPEPDATANSLQEVEKIIYSWS